MLLQILSWTSVDTSNVSRHAKYFLELSNLVPLPPYEKDTITVWILQTESMRLKTIK